MRRVGKGFSGNETPLFDTMLVQPQTQADEDVEMPVDEEQPATTSAPSTSEPQDQPSTPHDSPEQEPTHSSPHDSPLTGVNPPRSEEGSLQLAELMALCTSLQRKVDALEKDKLAQATEILSLKKRVEKLEKRRKSKPSVLRRLRKIGGMISDIDADAEISLVDETQRLDDDLIFDTTADLAYVTTISSLVTTDSVTITAVEPVSAAAKELTDNDMTMAEALAVKLSAHDEQVAKDLHDKIQVELEEEAKRQEDYLSFEEIQGSLIGKGLVDTFVPIGSEEDERRIKDLNTKAEEESSNKDVDSTNKRKKKIRMKRSSKKQKTDADLKEEEQIKKFLSIVPNEEEAIDYEVLDKRYQIVDWKSEFYHNDRYGEPHDYYRVFRADGSSRYIKTFTEMVSRFDRMDFLELHSLVMQRFETTTPEGIDLILWGDLKTMFEANAVDELWKNQEDWILKSWNLYENCGVHILMLEDGTEFHMLAERKYPLTKETLEKMLVLRLTAESESEAAFDLLRNLMIDKILLLVEDFAAAEVLKNLLQVVSAVRVNINIVFVS
ncbi:hypothetical protein Tco_1186351 [Tanacetum coccineum]